MDYRRLISRIASDKNSNKLGKIIRIDKLPGKTVKKYIPYAIILIRKPFRKDLTVPIEAEKLLKLEGTYAWFDVTKEEFEEEVKRLKEITMEREIYPGDTGVYQSKGVGGFRVDPLNLGHQRKERKR
ncbi:MAG: hypothetical protein JXA54_17120 [Candidatus Heimdallarchaeota archaeon]|nr:hypothetical protein [Candidatus Heimdallarchaeota archaeon]